MSFDLLNDPYVEQNFAAVRQIASLLESITLSRTNNVDNLLGNRTGALPHISSSNEDPNAEKEEDLFLPSSLSLPKSCGHDMVVVFSKLGHSLKVLTERLQKQTDTHFVAFYDHMKKKESSELEEICAKRKIIPQGFITHTQLVGQRFPTISAATEETPANIDSVLPLAGETIGSAFTGTSLNDTIPYHSAHPEGKGGGLRNAPLARKLKERRDAASTLQSFMFLVLETCIAQSEASCAAVFLNGHAYKGNDSKDPSRTPSKAPESVIDRDSPPRFLHCVANMYGEGNFPTEVSYATLNPLTAVVQTGVSVNLRNTECPELPTVDGESRDMGTDDNVSESIKKNVNKVIKINSGIIMPLGDFGCMVLANKRSTAVVNSFTVSDEHIAWGAALFITSVMTRYKKDLLLENPWFPVHIPLLRRFLTLPTMKETNVESRLKITPEVETAVVSNFGALASNLMTYISEGKGANMPKRMTIVRTADPKTSHVVPVELLPRNRLQSASTEQVSEEEIFQGAAQYISNLESLWHKTLAENNAAHTIMQNYDKEIEVRNEEIRGLESKMRKLNTRIVQLERQRGRSF